MNTNTSRVCYVMLKWFQWTLLRMQKMLINVSVFTQDYSYHTHDGYINVSVRNDVYYCFHWQPSAGSGVIKIDPLHF